MGPSHAPRILILETEPGSLAALRGCTTRGWRNASVQSRRATLAQALADGEAFGSYDLVLAGCDFAADGDEAEATLGALRAITADPASPPVVLLTSHGSEYTAVQAIRAGAFDYLQRDLLGREQIVEAVRRALTRGPRPTMPPAPGPLKLFGYDMRRQLAAHDNVSVHVAFSAEQAREVVVKVLHRGRAPLSRDRHFESFVNEFKLHYDIADPAVADIYDFRVTQQYCYIAMEYFPLGHLGLHLKGALEPADAFRHAGEIAAALSIIHAAGVVHRDLKPGNVMLRDDGSIALIDFGISRLLASDTTVSHGSDDPICGTPYYMSPEQARGETTDERTDIYALGVLLYQMLTGEKPYVGSSAEAILEQHATAPLPRLPDRLAAFQPMLERMLAKSPALRLANARELSEVIESATASLATASRRAAGT